MPTITFEGGKKVTTNKVPTAQDIEEIAQQLKLSPVQSSQGTKDEPGYQMPEASGSSGVSSIPSGLARGVVKGGQGILETLGNLSELTGKGNAKTPYIGSDFIQQSKQALDQLLPPVHGVIGNIAEGLGQLPGIATQLEVGGPAPEALKFAALGAINSQKGGLGAMATEGGKQALIGQLLHMAGQTNNPALSGALGAGIMGGASKLEGGSNDEAAAQAVIGGGLGIIGNAKVDKNSGISPNIPGADKLKEFGNKITSDPVKSTLDRLHEQQKEVGIKISSLDPRLAESEKAANEAMQADLQSKTDKIDASIKKVKSLRDDVSEKMAGLDTQFAEKKKLALEGLNSKANSDLEMMLPSKDKLAIEKAKSEAELTRQLTDRTGELDSQIDELNRKLNLGTENAPSTAYQMARLIQTKLPTEFKAMGDKYHEGYEKITKEIDNRTQDSDLNNESPISSSEATKVFLDMKDKLLAEGLGSIDPVFAKISKSLESLGRKHADTISFRELHGEVKSLIDSEGYKSHAADILRTSFGDLISQKLQGTPMGDAFSELQKSYKPVLDFKKNLSDSFSPYGGEGSLKSGEAFMKRVASGDLSGTDTKILRFLESGTVEDKPSSFTKGIGDVSSNLKKMGNRLLELEKEKTRIGDEKVARMAAIARKFTEEMNSLSEKGQLTEKQLEASKELMRYQLQAEFAKQRMEMELRQQKLDKGIEALKNRKGELKGMTAQQIEAIKQEIRLDYAKQRMDLNARKDTILSRKEQVEHMRRKIMGLENSANAIGMFASAAGGYRISRFARGVTMLKKSLRNFK